MSTTKKEYEEYLNDLGDNHGGAANLDDRVPEGGQLGTWLRRNDPIAFNVGYQEKCREEEFRREQSGR